MKALEQACCIAERHASVVKPDERDWGPVMDVILQSIERSGVLAVVRVRKVDVTLSQKDIEEIVGRIVRGYDPLAVILFGSQARGTAGDDTDVDLFILKEDVRKPVERNREVRRLLSGIVYPVDIFVRTPREFEQLRGVVGSLPYEAAHEGRVVYEREPGKGQPREKVDGARPS